MFVQGGEVSVVDRHVNMLAAPARRKCLVLVRMVCHFAVSPWPTPEVQLVMCGGKSFVAHGQRGILCSQQKVSRRKRETDHTTPATHSYVDSFMFSFPCPLAQPVQPMCSIRNPHLRQFATTGLRPQLTDLAIADCCDGGLPLPPGHQIPSPPITPGSRKPPVEDRSTARYTSGENSEL